MSVLGHRNPTGSDSGIPCAGILFALVVTFAPIAFFSWWLVMLWPEV